MISRSHRNPLRRTNQVRPINRGTGGRTPNYRTRIRPSDLPIIAVALGIDVATLVELARASVRQEATA